MSQVHRKSASGRGPKWLAVISLLVLTLCASLANAQMIIRNGGESHPEFLEIEAHGVLAPFSPPQGRADVGFGGGLRLGFNIAPTGFLPMVNDSVALGVGADYVRYFGSRPATGRCTEWRTTDQGGRLCVSTEAAGGAGGYLFFPAVMQWNFYLTPAWSVFGEPGLSVYGFDSSAPGSSLQLGVTPTMSVGGRWHFSDAMTLTMRLGYPYTTVGVSFFL